EGEFGPSDSAIPGERLNYVIGELMRAAAGTTAVGFRQDRLSCTIQNIPLQSVPGSLAADNKSRASFRHDAEITGHREIVPNRFCFALRKTTNCHAQLIAFTDRHCGRLR